MARHEVTVHLASGHTETFTVSEDFSFSTSEATGEIVSYDFEVEGGLSALYFKPEAIVSIKGIVLKENEAQS